MFDVNFSKLRVLVVDDSRTMRSIIAHVLQTPLTFVKEGKFMVPRRSAAESA